MNDETTETEETTPLTLTAEQQDAVRMYLRAGCTASIRIESALGFLNSVDRDDVDGIQLLMDAISEASSIAMSVFIERLPEVLNVETNVGTEERHPFQAAYKKVAAEVNGTCLN